MGAWDKNWEQRISAFAASKGFPHIWDYLVAHPGVSLVAVADEIDDAAAIQIHQMIVKHCVEARKTPELICDLMAREIRDNLPEGWRTGSDFNHSQATFVGSLPEPYASLASDTARALLGDESIPKGWRPASGGDELLRRALRLSLESLPKERRERIERGEIEPQPGDAYWAKVEPIWEHVSIYDGGETFIDQFRCVQPTIGNLLAAHWCQSEVRNGGFHQFFTNATGVLAPEAAAAFLAIGMPASAATVDEAMRFFEKPYPRDRDVREEALSATNEGPFDELDDKFLKLLDEESGGFEVAADRFSAGIQGSPWAGR